MGNRPEKQEAKRLAMQWGVGECGDCGATIVLGESRGADAHGLCAYCAAARAAAPLPDMQVVFAESAEVTQFARRMARSMPALLERHEAA